MSETSVNFHEETPRSKDGTALHAYRWAPREPRQIKAQVLILHGYAEHGARYREFAHAMVGHGIACTALDYRGHGKAGGQRGYCKGFDRYHDDVDAGWQTLDRADDSPPRFLLGHSHGALLALDYIDHGRGKGLTGLILSNPFLAVAMHVPVLKEAVANLASSLFPRLSLPAGIPAAGMSRDQDIVAAYARDPLVFSIANAGWFGQVKRAQTRVRAMRQLPYPVLYAHSDADPVASPEANASLAAQLESPDKTVVLRPGGLHELLNETDRQELYEIIAAWLLARC